MSIPAYLHPFPDIEAEQNAYFYNTQNDFVVIFDDTTIIRLERTHDDMVYVNVDDTHVYTCFFPSQAEHDILHVIHIFKEEDIMGNVRMNIAEAAGTLCMPVNEIKKRQLKEVNEYKRSPLRHTYTA